MVDGLRLRGSKSEKGNFISIHDAIDLSLRESRHKSGYGTFRKELAVEFHRWKEDFQRGKTQFSLSDNIIVNLEVYLSQNQAGKWSTKALKIVQDNRPDLFGKTKESKSKAEIQILSRVYFIKGESTGNIKIGHSRNPEGRIRGFQTASSEKLTIIKTIEGGEKVEKELHQRFAHINIRGEWFRAEPELNEFINGLE